MTSSLTVVGSHRIKWRPILLYVLAGCAFYVLSSGPVTRYAPEFADWFYTPLGPLVEIPMAGALLRGWLSLWGVDVELNDVP